MRPVNALYFTADLFKHAQTENANIIVNQTEVTFNVPYSFIQTFTEEWYLAPESKEGDFYRLHHNNK